jgi:hypothetical protein
VARYRGAPIGDSIAPARSSCPFGVGASDCAALELDAPEKDVVLGRGSEQDGVVVPRDFVDAKNPRLDLLCNTFVTGFAAAGDDEQPQGGGRRSTRCHPSTISRNAQVHERIR